MKDCFRLGDTSCPRPILIKFVRSSEATLALTKIASFKCNPNQTWSDIFKNGVLQRSNYNPPLSQTMSTSQPSSSTVSRPEQVPPNCYYINIMSIVNKSFQFQSFIYSHHFDIIAITETWLSNNIFYNEILPTNYRIYCNDHGCRGGGVLLAVHDNITNKIFPLPTNIEMVSEFLNLLLYALLTYLPILHYHK